MKIEKEQWQMVTALVAVAVVATILLGLTDIVTRTPIAEARKAALVSALDQVLPAHANDPLTDTRTMASDRPGAEPITVYLARNNNGAIAALAWEVIAPDGYSGSIHILMGVHPDGRIQAIRITDHRETPGLGDGIVTNHAWLQSFDGQSLTSVRWAVKKDGGDFDQFTGATITPRAVVKAVHRGLELFRLHRQALLQPDDESPAREAP